MKMIIDDYPIDYIINKKTFMVMIFMLMKMY